MANQANNPKLFADVSEKVIVRFPDNADQRSPKTNDSSRAKSKVGDINNLEVFEYIGGKCCINESISSARAGTMVM